MTTLRFLSTATALVAWVSPAKLMAQQSDSSAAKPTPVRGMTKLDPITVTATRQPRPVFMTANPVLVIDSGVVRREAPNGVSDLFRNLPGVDVTGVGPNQTRLVIRGQRGQRILLAEDGIRLNNSRRQQDFGELPAITDINGISQVEIVRGPASVLYGTDAIGGIVNQITLRPPGAGQAGVRGSVLYRRSSADGQNMIHGLASGRTGKLGFVAGAGYRSADSYLAPAGRFGRLSLQQDAKVNDTGVTDQTHWASASYDVSEQHQVTLRVARYDARDAGFGYVDGPVLGDTSGVKVRLLYPDQDVTRVTAGYRALALGSPLADRFSATIYRTANHRIFDQQIDIPFGAPLPPTAGLAIRSRNITDINTVGARFEAAKVLGGRHTLTYGLDWYLDHSRNTDSSTTTTNGFGPPRVRSSTAPTIPNANAWSTGLFSQVELRLHDRFTLGLGLRAQAIGSETRQTLGLSLSRGGISASNQTLVGGISGQFAVTERINLMATAGRAFRAPNLVERYFDGVTAEGNGYLTANRNLAPETSFNIDFGVKIRTDRWYGELMYFANTIADGIRIVPLGTRINNFPAYQNQNIQRLRDRGFEALAELRLAHGFEILGHATKLTSKNPDNNIPVGDSYGSKVGGQVSWRDPKGRLFVGYEVRHQGERKDLALVANPVGDRLPAFTVHTARGEFRLGALGGVNPSLGVAVANLTNALYAEASNTSFFRPESRRSVIVTIRIEF